MDRPTYTDFFPCSYLKDQKARFIAAYATQEEKTVCEQLSMRGFRRSGKIMYFPACGECRQCVPVRIDVNRFKPNRTQRKLFAKQSRYQVQMVPLVFQQEHFDLYTKYLAARHPASEMTQDSREQYADYMLETPLDSALHEFRDAKTRQLKIVSLIDRLPLGLSAVYTFYDPDNAKESLGTFAILWQIDCAKRLNLPYVYLGFYIAACKAMSYKNTFSGVEGFVNGVWQPLHSSESAKKTV